MSVFHTLAKYMGPISTPIARDWRKNKQRPVCYEGYGDTIFAALDKYASILTSEARLYFLASLLCMSNAVTVVML